MEFGAWLAIALCLGVIIDLMVFEHRFHKAAEEDRKRHEVLCRIGDEIARERRWLKWFIGFEGSRNDQRIR